MADVRIYRPTKTANSSGRFKTRFWVIEPEPTSRQLNDRLMGWIGHGDTERQVTLRFPTKEAAIAYCDKHGLTYAVSEPQQRIVRPKSYADNFIRKV